jgi:hypothetical protein
MTLSAHDRTATLEALRAHAPELRKQGIDHLFLFGSVARDEASAASDVDLFFDFSDRRFGAIELLRVREGISEILGRKADLMTGGSLHPRLRSVIEQGAIQVF